MIQAFVTRVMGMTCGGCVRAITNAIKARAPSANVRVDLTKGTVTVDSADPRVVDDAIRGAGYEIGDMA